MAWPIQSVHRFDQRVQNFQDKFSEGPDLRQLNLLSSSMGWKITDARVFYPNSPHSTTPIAEARWFSSASCPTPGSVIGKHPLSDFLSTPTSATGLRD